jgi:hypothetical protein
MKSNLKFQAVVVDMSTPDPTGTLDKIALFDKDENPFGGSKPLAMHAVSILTEDIFCSNVNANTDNAAVNGESTTLFNSAPGTIVVLQPAEEAVYTTNIPVKDDDTYTVYLTYKIQDPTGANSCIVSIGGTSETSATEFTLSIPSGLTTYSSIVGSDLTVADDGTIASTAGGMYFMQTQVQGVWASDD